MRPDGGAGSITAAPTAAEWALFLEWAALEGWRVPARELALYRGELAGSAFVLRDGADRPLGFVTVCRHQRSAWIGNLLVAPWGRGRGFGRRLFEHAVACLAERNNATLWLTASPGGAPLYASSGFREVGRIERWVGRGRGATAAAPAAGGLHGGLYSLVKADAAACGDSRAELLTSLACGGRILRSGHSIALVQAGDGLHVIGPWISVDHCPRANRTILTDAVEGCREGDEMAVDLYDGAPERTLLAAAGFAQSGETVLMCRGETERTRTGGAVALATLGSMG
jgi:GNAT superfamily N-acetyltransferase